MLGDFERKIKAKQDQNKQYMGCERSWTVHGIVSYKNEIRRSGLGQRQHVGETG